MERNIAVGGSKREAWEGGFIVHTERQADTPSTVGPELVLPELARTIDQHGREVGRMLFKKMFPDMEELFNDRYGMAAPGEAT